MLTRSSLVVLTLILLAALPATAQIEVTTNVTDITGAPGTVVNIEWTSRQSATASEPARDVVWDWIVPPGLEYVSGSALRPGYVLTSGLARCTYFQDDVAQTSYSNAVSFNVTEATAEVNPPDPVSGQVQASTPVLPPGAALVVDLALRML